MNEYARITTEVEKNLAEVQHLNSEREAIMASANSLPEAEYQRELGIVERFLAREQLKLEQNRNILHEYDRAHSLLGDLDRLNNQYDDVRDDIDRQERDEEIAAKRNELQAAMQELPEEMRDELRSSVIAERTLPISPNMEINETREPVPEITPVHAEEIAEEPVQEARQVKVRRVNPNRVINVIPSRVASEENTEENNTEASVTPVPEITPVHAEEIAEEPVQEARQVKVRRVNPNRVINVIPSRVAREENTQENNTEASVTPVPEINEVATQEPTLSNPTLGTDLTPEEAIRIYEPAASQYEEAGITGTRAQNIVEEANNMLESNGATTEAQETPVRRTSVDLNLTPEEVIRVYGPSARIYDSAGITGTRAQQLVEEANRTLAAREETREESRIETPERRNVTYIPSRVATSDLEGIVNTLNNREDSAVTDQTVEKTNSTENLENLRNIVNELDKQNPTTIAPAAPEEPSLESIREAYLKARDDYEVSTERFRKIFDDETQEIRQFGPYNQEQFDEYVDKYSKLKREENARWLDARRRMQEYGEQLGKANQKQTNATDSAQQVEPATKTVSAPTPPTPATQPTSPQPFEGSVDEIKPITNGEPPLGLPPKSEPTPLGLPPHEPTPAAPVPPEEPKALPPHEPTPPTPVPPSEPTPPAPVPTQEETPVKKGVNEIIYELTDGLNLTKKMDKKYRASNIRTSKEFTSKLKTGNVLYNVVGLVPAIIKVPINFTRKIVNKLTYSIEERKNVEKLKERIWKLSETDIETLWKEYRGTKVIQERYVPILNTLLNERMQDYAQKKVAILNEQITNNYQILFAAMHEVDECDKRLANEHDPDKIKVIENVKKSILEGKADLVKAVRAQYVEANQWMSGGAHGFEEDMKAASTKMTLVGKRFAKDHDFDPELAKRQANLEKLENKAIAEHNDELALKAFTSAETLLMGETEIKNTIFGQRSTGQKYAMPVVEKVNYNDDPFVRDLLTTIAVTSAAVSAVSAINTHVTQGNDILQHHQSEIDSVNAANNATMDRVHQIGTDITDNADAFVKGGFAQTKKDIINSSHTLERAALDRTAGSSGWAPGTSAYNQADALAHAQYNSMADAAKAELDSIASKYSSGAITPEQALEMVNNVANANHTKLVEIYQNYQPVLENYAATHPFDLHGVQESMEYVLNNPDAIIKMNEGMVESITLGKELTGLSAEHIAAINSLPSDLRQTLFANGAAAVALTYNVANRMNSNAAAGKYGSTASDIVRSYMNREQSETSNAELREMLGTSDKPSEAKEAGHSK